MALPVGNQDTLGLLLARWTHCKYSGVWRKRNYKLYVTRCWIQSAGTVPQNSRCICGRAYSGMRAEDEDSVGLRFLPINWTRTQPVWIDNDVFGYITVFLWHTSECPKGEAWLSEVHRGRWIICPVAGVGAQATQPHAGLGPGSHLPSGPSDSCTLSAAAHREAGRSAPRHPEPQVSAPALQGTALPRRFIPNRGRPRLLTTESPLVEALPSRPFGIKGLLWGRAPLAPHKGSLCVQGTGAR